MNGQPFFSNGPNFALQRTINRKNVIKHAHALLPDIGMLNLFDSDHNLGTYGYHMMCSFPKLGQWRPSIRPKSNGSFSNISS